jgi:hypothetical protein
MTSGITSKPPMVRKGYSTEKCFEQKSVNFIHTLPSPSATKTN